MSDKIHILILHCKKCDITKELLLTEENVSSNGLGIWPFFSLIPLTCSKCLQGVDTILKESENV